MLTALAAPVLYPVMFCSMTFADGDVNIWSGIGNTTWNGITWTGLGDLLGMSTAEEGTDVKARGITLHISGLNPAMINNVLNNYLLGSAVTIYLGLYDGSGNLIDSPATVWEGRLDQPTIVVDSKQVTLSIACESRLIEMNVPVELRYTNQQQQLETPGDLGLIWMNAIQEMTLQWGSPAAASRGIGL
jgi:hypothetical protein